MSAIDVTNTINQMANDTAQAAAVTAKGGNSKMDGDMFLKLMLEQLKYQDPMDPVDNKEFLAQQAQFTQVSETQQMSKSITQNNSIMQTLAVVGKNVTLTNPDDKSKTITGVVSEASFSGDEASITVNGKEYPFSSVTSVKNATTASSK